MDWKNNGFVIDGTWLTGTTSIGYGDNDDTTILNDMQGSYSTVYLRHEFTVENTGQILGRQGVLNHYLDDGAIIYINGMEVTRINVTAGIKNYNSLSGINISDATWNTYTIADLSSYLVVGTNTIAVQMLNSTLTSSDLSFDIELKSSESTSILSDPTPGAPNTVATSSASSAPPAIRQITHLPKQPLANQAVTITAKVTDPDGVQSVTLFYQIVDPGAYLPAYIAWTPSELQVDPNRPPLPNPDFEDAANWTQVSMSDDGLNGDLIAGDAFFSVTLPPSLQVHRRMIRYRIRVEDSGGVSVRVPYLDDPNLNFAYFCYDGEPSWSGAIQPGGGGSDGQVATYGTDVMRSMPTYHLLSKNQEVEWCQWTNLGRTTSAAAAVYNWQGAFVYDGEVYDHIRYRIRGWSHPYNEGKNKWKFDFNRGRPFQARDNLGKKYPKEWDKLNFLAGYSHRIGGAHPGEEGMIVAANSRLFNLAGVPSPSTHFVQFRVIDSAEETSLTSQYDGDYWGLYIAMEQPDGRFLDSHGLADGNLYKMNGDGTDLNNQGPTQPNDWSDLNAVESSLNASPSASWFRANAELDNYYSYRSICEAVHHFDISSRSNHLMYHNPDTNKWWMLPWDFDLSWSSNIYSNDSERFKQSLNNADINIEYQNRAREIRDLLFNAEQGATLIDELASYIDRPDTAFAFVDADRAMWDYHPRGEDPGKYFDYESGGTFDGVVARMKTWMGTGWGGARLDSKSADSAIPSIPSIQYTGTTGYPLGGLSFQCSAFSSGFSSFQAMQWRAGEIHNPLAPAYDPTAPRSYEITSQWETGEINTYNNSIAIPTTALRVGHTYRVRVRMKDTTGRWSHWSAPDEFTVGEPDVTLWQENLVISEFMYNPPEPSSDEEWAASTNNDDFEFIELHNTSAILTLDLTDIRFTKGVDFNFLNSAITSIAPGGYVLVVKNQLAFEARYGTGLPVAGEFINTKLSNGGEQIKLSYGSGVAVRDFIYDDHSPWPSAPDGQGASLILIDPQSVPDHTLATSWTASGGATPGAPEPAMGTYAQWQQLNFTPLQSRSPAIAGPDADPDGDGYSNQSERAFATNPQSYDIPINQFTWIAKTGKHFPAIRFQRLIATTDLLYELETSPDLISWQTVPSTLLIESQPTDSIEQVIVHDNLPDSDTNRFLRIRVSQIP